MFEAEEKLERFIIGLRGAPSWSVILTLVMHGLVLFFLMDLEKKLNLSLGDQRQSILVAVAGLVIATSFIIMIVLAILFHSAAVILGGECDFNSFFKVNSIMYVIPTLLNVLGLFDVNPLNINLIIAINYIVSYITSAIAIHYMHKLSFFKSLLAVMFPIAGIVALTHFFRLIE